MIDVLTVAELVYNYNDVNEVSEMKSILTTICYHITTLMVLVWVSSLEMTRGSALLLVS